MAQLHVAPLILPDTRSGKDRPVYMAGRKSNHTRRHVRLPFHLRPYFGFIKLRMNSTMNRLCTMYYVL